MQLFSVEKKVTQAIEGHAAAFCDFKLSPTYTATIICIAANTANGGKLFVMEVPGNRPADAPTFARKAVPIQFPTATDFPVAMQASEKHGFVYMITKAGYLYLYELESATLLYQNRISSETIFVTAPHEATHGVIGVNKVGQVLSVSINEQTIVKYLTQKGFSELAIKLAARANLEGAGDLYVQQFNNFLSQMNVDAAVKIAVDSPQGILRTPQTIERFKRLPQLPNQKPALSQYFQYIIEKGSLNNYESIELAKIVLQKPGGVDYIKKLIGENKMESSEELGDIVAQYNNELAMKIYLAAKAHEKIINNLLSVGDYVRVLQYCQKVGYQPNYLDLFRRIVQLNPQVADKFAVMLNEKPDTALDPNVVVDIFVQSSLIKQATAYLLDYLKDDKPEHAELQTRLLKINLMYSPVQVVDSILAQKLFSHFNKNEVAQMCEKVQLFQRALENYTELKDRKRVIVNTQYIDNNWLVGWFEDVLLEDSLALLRELLRVGQRQNLNLVVQVATKYSEEMGPENLIPVFEEVRSYEGLFYYLGSIIEYSENPDVHFKYIEAATRVGQYPEVERVTRESQFYDPEKTKEFLKEARLQDQTPLINVCDRFDYIQELVNYLFNNNQLKFIEFLCKQKNPLRTPVVVGALLDVDANEDFIKNILQAVGNLCPIDPLVEEVEKRNRLKLLTNWLEARANEGIQEPGLYNSLAKIYIDSSNNAEHFLQNNPFYDSRTVGKYCEKRDPHLAFIAYKRGQCDVELVDVTNKNGMFKQQARYLVERQSPDLWAHVLNDDNQYRRQLIDQVVSTALPESDKSEEVSVTVQAFMTANLPNELIELLEKIVLHGKKEFRTNKNLQNLLILTAIKADKTRVMEYINKLDNYDAPDIAKIAVDQELFEEGFLIYSKFKLNANAIRVLIEHIQKIQKAADFAASVNEPEVWSILARAQLAQNLIPESIDSFLKADDPNAYQEVTAAAERNGHYQPLIKFLKMARSKVHDTMIDTELVYAFAKLAEQKPATNALADLEDFISAPNTAQIQGVGERCFEEGLYEAARILFSSISNYARLASALVKLGRNREAVAAANKANSIKTWKEVLFACVDAGEFRYALSCGLNIIVHPDEMEDLIQYYEQRGHFNELIELLEKGLGLERAHKGIFTELGICYAKYKPEKLMEHISRYWQRSNIPKLINVCERYHLWAEMRFLYCHHDEYDSAVKIMMEHSADAFDHSVFTEAIVKAVNMELYYRAIQFYLDEQPNNIDDLLNVLTPKLDHERVARDARGTDTLPIIKKYLEQVQINDLAAVNEALNSLYVEEEDYEALRYSIDNYKNFDQVQLAKELQGHDLLEFRRISAYLYKLNKQWEESIALSKKDNLYKDAMETAAESRKQEVAEELLQFFVDNDLKDCFAATLYTCYDLVRPDVALELGWRYRIQDMSMPFLIQVVREYTSKVDELYRAHKDQQKKKNDKTSTQTTKSETPQPTYSDQAAYDPYYQQQQQQQQQQYYQQQQYGGYSGYEMGSGGYF
jgi:clathrin heavy chain